MSEMWQAARRQIGEYEQKSSELALVLQTEKDNLQSVQAEIESLNKERAGVLKKAGEVEAKAQKAREQLANLTGQAEKAAEEGQVLMKHLELYRDSKRELTTQMELDRQQHEEHVSRLAAMLEQYRHHLAAAQPATADA